LKEKGYFITTTGQKSTEVEVHTKKRRSSKSAKKGEKKASDPNKSIRAKSEKKGVEKKGVEKKQEKSGKKTGGKTAKAKESDNELDINDDESQ
jgi:hypothetical protein